VLAHFAIHVIATLVFLNASLAIGTFARIGQNPIRSFTFITALFLPFNQLCAATRIMRLFPTLKAIGVATQAVHGGDA
jgi:hypothetical protein